MLPFDIKIADLYFGHPGKFIQFFKGTFNPQLSKVPIQLGQLFCGCWVILDGNSRIGLIYKKHPDASISDFPSELFSFYKAGEWDEELIRWWNPYPKTIREIMQLTKELNKLIYNKSTFSDQRIYQRLVGEVNAKINSEKHICISKSGTDNVNFLTQRGCQKTKFAGFGFGLKRQLKSQIVSPPLISLASKL